ncbi:MAG: hypothetical protein RLZZ231_673 [Bacteroidota bacterium]
MITSIVRHVISKQILLAVLLVLSNLLYAQEVTLYNQFNGRFDYTFIGNTLNSAENNVSPFYVTNTSSSANLSLNPSNNIVKAYLYWAGSGDGDFNVDLNGIPLTAERTFSHTRLINQINFTYFSAFKDITSLITATGNGTYALSNLDISAYEALHFTRSTNFAGWAILIVYQNDNLPLNQLNIYDGLQGVPDSLQINLTNLFVVDPANATVGFIAWEGDSQLATESFFVNTSTLSNTLNPLNNVFNGTNSITNEMNLFNMDLDIYNIENAIEIGDTQATISLNSTGDFIMINTVVTKLNSQLPDATISINNITQSCNTRRLELDFSVSNQNATDILPALTPISFYANSTLITTVTTPNPIGINSSWTGSVSLTIPATIAPNFTLKSSVDDNGQNQSTVIELNENNNSASNVVSLWLSPNEIILPPLTSCNEGNSQGNFNLNTYLDILSQNSPNASLAFFESLSELQMGQNSIQNLGAYHSEVTPKEVFYKMQNDHCERIGSFLLITANCPPIIYNYVTPNNDGFNDDFMITGLKDVFINFQLEIYNRWGRLVWTGNNGTENWDGYSNQKVVASNEKCPSGVYYYVLELNDPNYPQPLTGWILLQE